ncbi:MAG: hypothetical protein KJ559_03220 [Nanoarchaeota archaeon]|nr:hypothetical protein [Nanoarchaeota archaeon]
MAEIEPVKYAVWLVIGVAAIMLIVGATTAYFTNASGAISRYVFFGTADLGFADQTITGQIGVLITSLMVWLIIFAGFGDILENFSAFSKGIAWVIAFAIAIVAANTGIIKFSIVWLIGSFAWLGTFAIVSALVASFIAFFVVNWGMSGLTTWLKNRQTMIGAATGRTYAAEGLKTLKKVGEGTEN